MKVIQIMKKMLISSMLIGSLFTVPVNAQETKVVAVNEVDPNIEVIRTQLRLLAPRLKTDSIIKSPIAGLYEVMYGFNIIYISSNGRFLIQDDEIIDLVKRENLTQPRINPARIKAVNAMGEENMIIFGKKDAKYTISVFTDIDCGYCRQMHSKINEFIENDIRIRYLFFPRAGIGSESYKKAVSVWCADDKKAAMTEYKQGKKLDSLACDNPILKHMALAEELGVNATPTLILPDGFILPGALSATKLKATLDAQEK